MKTIKFNIAHAIARQLKGDYSARMSIALKLVNKSLNQLKSNQLSSDYIKGHGKANFVLYCKGLGRYCTNTTEFYALSEEITQFIKSEIIGFNPEEILNSLNNYKQKLISKKSHNAHTITESY